LKGEELGRREEFNAESAKAQRALRREEWPATVGGICKNRRTEKTRS
jgi:hypothetical protein